MEFMVKLLIVSDTKNVAARDDLYGNCTHVAGNYWLFEGDEDSLNEGITFEIVGEEAVEATGDLSGKEIRTMVKDLFGVSV